MASFQRRGAEDAESLPFLECGFEMCHSLPMSTNTLGLMRVKVVALAVADAERAKKFYGDTLGLAPAQGGGDEIGYDLENTILMLKPQADWYGRPTAELNARLTLQVRNAS